MLFKIAALFFSALILSPCAFAQGPPPIGFDQDPELQLPDDSSRLLPKKQVSVKKAPPPVDASTADPETQKALKGNSPFTKSEGIFICAKLKKSFRKKIKGKIYPFYKHEIFKVVDKVSRKKGSRSISKYYVKFSDKKFSLSKSRAWIGDSKLCGVVGDQVLLKNSTLGYNKVTNSTQEGAKVHPSGIYNVVSLLKTKTHTWVRLAKDGEVFYIDFKEVSFDFSTDDVLVTQTGIFSVLGFHIYLDLGWTGNAGTSRLKDLITDIPDESDVSQLQDPLVTNIKPGSGFGVHVYSYPWQISERLNTFLSLGYQTATYTWEGLANTDDNGPIPKSQLDTEVSGDIKIEDIVLKFGLMREFVISNQVLVTSINLVGIFTMTPQPAIAAKVGCITCIGKREDISNIANQADAAADLNIRLELPLSRRFRFSFEASQTQGVGVNLGFLVL